MGAGKDVVSEESKKALTKIQKVMGAELPIPTEMIDPRHHRVWSPDLRITAVDLAHGARAKGVDVGGNDGRTQVQIT